MKLYGLFYYTYHDTNEYEYLEVVSKNRGKLECYERFNGEVIPYPAETWEQHKELAMLQKSHYYIEEVEVV